MLNRKWKQRERLRQLRLEEYKRQRLLSKQTRVSVKSSAKTKTVRFETRFVELFWGWIGRECYTLENYKCVVNAYYLKMER